jgi:hypothetical protein
VVQWVFVVYQAILLLALVYQVHKDVRIQYSSMFILKIICFVLAIGSPGSPGAPGFQGISGLKGDKGDRGKH